MCSKEMYFGENNAEPRQETLSRDVQEILDIILTLLKKGVHSFTPPEFIADNEEFKQILAIFSATQDFCDALRKGEIDYFTKTRGYTISQLKAVQIELRDLIWQMQEISKGENYSETFSHSNLTSSFHSMMGHLTSKIENLDQSQKNYQEISSRDPLTDAYNRNALGDVFIEAINSAVQKGHSCAALFLDIDFFKKINDTYGHNVGDIVLKEFVRRINCCKRDTDLCCRLGGEEFLILLPNVIENFIADIEGRFRKEITEKEIPIGAGKSVAFSYSAGITYFAPQSEMTKEELLKIINFADELLYEAKNTGRNKSIIKKYE